MGVFPRTASPLALSILLAVTAPAPPSGAAEDLQAPGAALEHIQIQVATRIEGRLIGFDPYDEAIWIQYTRYYDGRSWRQVPFDAQLQLYARDAEMMTFFRALPKGTLLRATVFIGDDGKRRIVALEET